jgi:hypothetical protein
LLEHAFATDAVQAIADPDKYAHIEGVKAGPDAAAVRAADHRLEVDPRPCRVRLLGIHLVTSHTHIHNDYLMQVAERLPLSFERRLASGARTIPTQSAPGMQGACSPLIGKSTDAGVGGPAATDSRRDMRP